MFLLAASKALTIASRSFSCPPLAEKFMYRTVTGPPSVVAATLVAEPCAQAPRVSVAVRASTDVNVTCVDLMVFLSWCRLQVSLSVVGLLDSGVRDASDDVALRQEVDEGDGDDRDD